MSRIFKRKRYDRFHEWKHTQNGKSAMLIEGARRVGKSTLVEQFAKNEYESYILIDFNEASEEVKSSGYNAHKSLDVFCEKFSQKVDKRYLIYTKDLHKDGPTLLVPAYMTMFL